MKNIISILSILFFLTCSQYPVLFTNEGNFSYKSKINRILADSNLDALMGIKIISLNDGRILYELNSNKLYTPASNNKLYTCASALHYLGEHFTFSTSIYVINNNIILKGGGDPDLTIDQLDSLADIVSKRINVIDTLYIDASAMDSIDYGEGWMWDEGAWWYAAPISALSLNDNCIDFFISPGQIGSPAIVNYSPPTKYISLSNNSLTVGKSDVNKKIKLDRNWISKNNHFTVSGEIFFKEKIDTLRRNIHDPSLFTGTVFKELLKNHGVEISNLYKLAQSKNLKPLSVHISKPLIHSARNLMNESDNLTAELFVKMIGKSEITSGNLDSGLDSVRTFLYDSVLIDTNRIRLADGSGVSRYNLTTPSDIVKLLEWMYHSKYKDSFISTLSGGGWEHGTMEGRLKKEGGMVRAKTGGLSGVSNLSGYVFSPRLGPLAFSILMNGYTGSSTPYRQLQNKIIQLIIYG